MKYSFGYPAFKVLFQSKLDEQAPSQAGLNGAFLRAIDELSDRCPKLIQMRRCVARHRIADSIR